MSNARDAKEITMTTMNSEGAQQPVRGKVGLGVRNALARFYPNYTSENDLFLDMVARYLRADSVVLDAGCGSGAFRYGWKQQVQFLVGCDLDDGLPRNANIHAGAFADLAQLPFTSQAFDVVFSHYVMEHIDAPQPVFAEFGRVLKPGGKLILLTPSKHHYVALLGRLLPHWFHEKIGGLRGNAAHDVFPTRYRANSHADLNRYGPAAELALVEYMTTEARPNYLMWSLPSFLLGVAYERVVNRFHALSPFRSSIIAVFERLENRPG